MDSPSFDVRYRLSRDEFLVAHRAHLGRSLLTVRTIGLVTLALALGALQAQLFGSKELALKIYGALWVAVLGFIAYAYLGLPVRIFRERPELSAEQRLQLDGQGVRIGAEGESGEYVPWDQIEGLFEMKGFLFLTRKQRLPIVIPLRIFSPGEQESVRELCARSFFEK